jgi:hypothetical protein
MSAARTARAPARRHARPAPRRRRIDPLRHRRRTATPIATADLALHDLMETADLYRVGRKVFLVAQIYENTGTLDRLIEAMGATEDLEEETDIGADDRGEPSLLTADDREFDDGEMGEDILGWQDDGSQEHLYHNAGGDRESDGDCDCEPETDRGIDDEPHDAAPLY